MFAGWCSFGQDRNRRTWCCSARTVHILGSRGRIWICAAIRSTKPPWAYCGLRSGCHGTVGATMIFSGLPVYTVCRLSGCVRCAHRGHPATSASSWTTAVSMEWESLAEKGGSPSGSPSSLVLGQGPPHGSLSVGRPLPLPLLQDAQDQDREGMRLEFAHRTRRIDHAVLILATILRIGGATVTLEGTTWAGRTGRLAWLNKLTRQRCGPAHQGPGRSRG